jgi:ubiquinone/menaquinone biosynthesis C-methylase UbiE
MRYVLGSDDPEIKRLDQQAGWLEEPTRLLLRLSGIEQGMHVLDLGTGLGHVALAVADLVGPSGQVVAIDSDDRMLAVARERAGDRTHVHFVKGDVRTWTCAGPFDAVVGRLILFHLPDAVDAVEHHLAHLRPGGRFVAIDYDVGSCRAEPQIPLVEVNTRRVIAAFQSAGANPVIGTRLALLLADAGLVDIRSIGLQGYIAPDDLRGPAMLAGVVRSLAAQMRSAGIATADELGIDTLQERLAAEAHAARSVVVPPALVGAWGRLAA